MSQFLGLPKVQFLDSNGDPLSGGKLYTYEPGTTTNKASYPSIADAKAGTNANANPIILDSRGEANVALAGNTKLKLDDSSDNNIWTVDNVNGDADVLDVNGNEMLIFNTTASAVNHLKISNAATGNDVVIDTAGDDATPDLTIQADGGSGTVTVTNLVASGITLVTPLSISASSSSASELRLPEDTDNGSNYISLKSPAAISTTTTFILPDGDGTSGQVLETDGSSGLAWGNKTTPVSQADQAALEAETDEDTYVPPDLVNYNPGVAKAWGHATVSGGVPSLTASRNISSIVDNGTGDIIFTIDTDFSTSNYSAVVTIESTSGSTSQHSKIKNGGQTAGTVQVSCLTTVPAVIDPAAWSFVAFGDQ